MTDVLKFDFMFCCCRTAVSLHSNILLGLSCFTNAACGCTVPVYSLCVVARHMVHILGCATLLGVYAGGGALRLWVVACGHGP